LFQSATCCGSKKMRSHLQLNRGTCSVIWVLDRSAPPFVGYMPFLLEWRGGSLAKTQRMLRSFSFRQLVVLRAGAVLSLLALALVAPRAAEAGCSHLVKSRADSVGISSLIEPLVGDVAGQLQESPAPASPRPCSGALCSGQPAVPAVPAGALSVQLDSWAWNALVSSWGLLDISSILSSHPSDPHPVRRNIAVFHPPPASDWRLEEPIVARDASHRPKRS
jgi:hypothetical protein